jgi:hypothetical protein
MAVSTAYAPLEFSGNGSTTAHAVSWPFFDGTLVATLVSAAGAETVKTITTHYTVSGGTDSDGLPATGTLTMVTALASGEKLRIERSTPKTQSSTWTKAGSFSAKSLEAALDRAMLLDQEVAYARELNWRTAWATATVYAVNDIVTHNGNVYLATAAHTSGAAADEPGIAADWDDYWDLLISSSSGGGLVWEFNTATSGDPGAGKFLLDNATLASVTGANISDSEDNAVDVSAFLATWDDSDSTIRGTIIIRNQTTQSSFAIYNVTGASTDNTTYYTLALTHVASSGTLADLCSIEWVRSGNTGATGSAGTDTGLSFSFDSSTTTAADPGTGDVRLNNATLASVTEISISYTGDDAADYETHIKTWDDSTNSANYGQLILKKDTAPANYAIFNITSTITDGTTYGRYTVTHNGSSGSFSNDDALRVYFTRTGNVGAAGAGSGDMLASTYDPATIAEQLVGLTAPQTLTNKTLTAPTIATITNGGAVTIPSGVDTLVGRASTDTLTNKTLTAPVISTISNTGTLTLPTSSDTLVGRATTDTLTNKTLTSPIINVTSDADGDIYYRASGALARLAKGTADQLLTMNAGATAPEWVTPSSASSDELVKAWLNATTAAVVNDSYGVASGTDHGVGDYSFTLSAAMADTFYAHTFTGQSSTIGAARFGWRNEARDTASVIAVGVISNANPLSNADASTNHMVIGEVA